MKLIHISVGTKDSHMMNASVRALRSEGVDIDFSCYDSSDLDGDPLMMSEMLGDAASADMITLKVHGDTSYFKRYDRLEKAIRDYGICTLLDCTEEDVVDSCRGMFAGTDEEHARCILYMELGGD